MRHGLNLQEVFSKKVVPLSDKFYGKDEVNGKELSFTNYYMMLDGKPFLGISGECHYSRVNEEQWEDTLRKMKMGGINIVAAYVFWIHHEEEEGKFRFDGNRNVRKFIQLCQKYGLYVIVRIGPFDHGEVRNGGLPDWLYGKPFEVRSLDPEFLAYVRTLYREFAKQFEGLYFKDGGPIIAAQMDNEYMHSAAAWEITTGITNEWVPGGADGNEYLLALKKIAQEEGIITPFYTCTGWGGAATPTEEILPLWGGYAFWPWIYFDYKGEHPKTPEYIYRDYHNDQMPKTYNFEPFYQPESMPYACCEMGGGMASSYPYRFQLPYESVDAMANVKLAGGCNFVGYYMYRGGSNPRGEKTLYLNESVWPKISYDYQAPIGEYGQIRPSYHRLRAVHLFLEKFGDRLCDLRTVLPDPSQEILPEDTKTLRYAVRTDGERGFLFLNNYQDHAVCQEKKEEEIILYTRRGKVCFPSISMAAGEEAILPFGMDLNGYGLICATAQPLTVMNAEGRTQYFFFIPEGMRTEYVLDGKHIHMIDGKSVSEEEIHIQADENQKILLDGVCGQVEIITLSRAQSLQFYQIQIAEKEHAVLSEVPIQCDGTGITAEHRGEAAEQTRLYFYPEIPFTIQCEKVGFWNAITLDWSSQDGSSRSVEMQKKGLGRYKLTLPELDETYKDWMLEISYKGDVGSLFENGILISDNFHNDAVWEVGLKEAMIEKKQRELTLLISPKKIDSSVISSSMAGRMELLKDAVEEVLSIKLQPVREKNIDLGREIGADKVEK